MRRVMIGAVLAAVAGMSGLATGHAAAVGRCATFSGDRAVVAVDVVAGTGACVHVPSGSRQGPQRWLTVHTTIEVMPADVALQDIDATVELRIDGWDAVQSSITGGLTDDVSVTTATAGGEDHVDIVPAPDGTLVYDVTNYVAAASVHEGDVPITIVVDGAGLRAATARRTTLQWVDAPPVPVVSAIDRSGWPSTSIRTGRTIDLPVVVSSQRADLTAADVLVDVRVDGAPVDVRSAADRVITAAGHLHRMKFAITVRSSGASVVTVTVRVPALGFEHTDTLQIEAHTGSTSSTAWLFVAAGVAVGLVAIVLGGRATAAGARPHWGLSRGTPQRRQRTMHITTSYDHPARRSP